MLLKYHLRKQALKIDDDDDDDDDTKASSTSQAFPQNETGKNTTTPPTFQSQLPAQTGGRPTEKAALTQITTLEVLVVLQKRSVVDRISDTHPKVSAEQDLRKLIDSTIVGKAIAYTPKDLLKKVLRRA